MAVKGGGVTINFSVNAANYSAGIKKVVEMNKQAAKSAQEAGHTTVSQMQATSAALRTLEGGMTNNLRAAERFAASLPGVGKALQAAFPVVGAVAIGTMFVEAGKKAFEFAEKLRQMPTAIAEGAQGMHASMQTNIDDLQITIDKLDIANDKLRKKPTKENELKLALDEAAKSADTLSQNAIKATEEVAKLIQTNSMNKFMQWAMGDQTGKVGDQAQQFAQKQRDTMSAGLAARADAGRCRPA